MSELDQRSAFVAGLRQLADFLESHPSLPVPVSGSHNAFADTKAELAAIAREPGVKWRKNHSGDYYVLAVKFAGGHSYEVNTDREKVCRRVVTGYEELPAETLPARTVETVEWVCDEPLLAHS